ncbi:MAG: hypothetical protein GXP34_02405 [Actinobacteria bacterium]|nr:hypothetical protein [Actinomycetota bacterium]
MGWRQGREPMSPRPITWRLVAVVAVVLGMLLVSCGSQPAFPTATIDADTAHQLMLTGVNNTGITAPTDVWVQVAQRGCVNGAWDWTVAKEVGDDATDIVGEPLPADLVWILTVTACHDLVPAAAIEQGPPS